MPSAAAGVPRGDGCLLTRHNDGTHSQLRTLRALPIKALAMVKKSRLFKNLMKEEDFHARGLSPGGSLFERLSQLIHSHQKFIITTHIVPDGDGLGGEVALATYLKELGKECRILNSDPTPDKFSLVDPDQEIEVWRPGMQIPQADMIFGVDVNAEERIGPLIEPLRKQGTTLIFIDHHILEEPLKSQHIIDKDISSMGEFFYRYFQCVNAEINFKMALAMYVSIMTDTKQFQHRRTTPLSHAIAAALVEIGVDPERVHQNVHQRRSLSEIRLLGESLKDIQITPDGKIAWIQISQTLQKKYGVTAEETQGFVDALLALRDVQIGIVFREEGNGKIKVSFRSKGRVEVYPIAKKLGGGGHAFEAGTLVEGSMKEVVDEVLEEIKGLI